jgi:hypothetical protein
MNTYGLLGDTRGLPTQKMLLARISKLILIPFLVVRLEPGTHKPHCDRSWITPIYSKGPWSLWNHQNGRSCTAQWCNSTLIWTSLLCLNGVGIETPKRRIKSSQVKPSGPRFHVLAWYYLYFTIHDKRSVLARSIIRFAPSIYPMGHRASL